MNWLKKIIAKLLVKLLGDIKVHKDVFTDIVNKADVNKDNFVSLGEAINFIIGKFKK